MMTVDIDPAIQAKPDLYSSIRLAHEEFNTYFSRGPTFDYVSAVWKLIPKERENSIVLLEMKDQFDSSVGVFPLDQLSDSSRVKMRMSFVLSDLLQTGGRRLLKELQDMGPVVDGD